MRITLLIIPACLFAVTTARRVQIRPRIAEPQVYYEDEDTAEAEEEYAAPVAYQPRTRALHTPRSKDTLQSSKAPPVQTIRNYNKVNDDGSFTFGYEAADGSFKEETRGTDCVVRGKYGYVDPDGNKREFTYVSGNPCDPNAPREDDDDLPSKQPEDDISGPANYPSVRPLARPRPNYPQTTTARAPTTIFQTEYQLDDDASQELEEDTKPRLAPQSFRRPQQNYLQLESLQSEAQYPTSPAPTTSLYRLSTPAPRYQSLTTPSPIVRSRPTTPSYRAVETSTRSIPRERPQSVAITPRPRVAQVAAQYVSPSSTERPGVVYATRPQNSPVSSQRFASTTASTPQHHLNFAAELERYVNTVGVTRPSLETARPSSSTPNSIPSGKVKSNEPIYQSELVYDPTTAQQQSHIGIQQQAVPAPRQQSPLYRQPARPQSQIQASQARPQEAIFRQQQAELLQQSQQLYSQQQRRQQQQHQPSPPHRFQLLESQSDPQGFYYIQAPSGRGPVSPLSVGQIDQFLRGGNPNF
ncbi:RNA polymerase II degradation factor 1-like isoform X2 [Venturia canescens]|uniref:RNA polymerase II degradation factor 1-like isoform X2 n=1 Tax=Venturia canescens TaxID=32260 RepID=UPI001C9BC414|nr:RNA polymerase II degradation factor 1-like isoform X2 [Venturia canescens]